MAREWVIKDYSGYQGLTLQDCEIQNAGPGEVRLRIEAFALNWGDMDLMLDRYSFSFEKFPARIGMEAAGIVGPFEGSKARQVLVPDLSTLEQFLRNDS